MSTKTTGRKNAIPKEIEVRIVKKRFYKEGYGIFEAEVLSGGDDVVDGVTQNTMSVNRGFGETTIVKGAFDREFLPNEEFTMYGSSEYSEKYKQKQWSITAVENKLNTPNQIRSFMMVCTKNKSVVDQLLQTYGDDLLDAIENNKIDHTKIRGLGEKTLVHLREKVLENKYMKEIIAELSQYDVTPTQMRKIMMKFGASAIKVVRENPYNLCKIKGIGFKKADQIAQKMGIDVESPHRIYECIRYVIDKEQQNGHTWIQENDLINKADKEMKGSVRSSLILAMIDEIAETNYLDAEMVVI